MNYFQLILVDCLVFVVLVSVLFGALLWRSIHQRWLTLTISGDKVEPKGQSESILVIPLEDEQPERSTSTRRCGLETNKFVSERCGHLDSETVRRLMVAFPQLTWFELTVWHTTDAMIDQVIDLLHHWQHTLTVLKVHITEPMSTQVSGHWPTLVSVVNRLTALTSLTVDSASVPLLPAGHIPKLDLPVLRQLSDFNFASGDAVDIVMDSLTRFATRNPKLWHIALGNAVTKQWWDHFFGMSLDFAFRFTHLKVQCVEVQPTQLRIFCSKFGSLVALSLEVSPHWSLHQLVTGVAPLAKLFHLELHIDFRKRTSFESEDDVDDDRWMALRSIKVVTLVVHPTAHTNLQSRHWGRVFVSVRVVRARLPHHCTCSVCTWRTVMDGGPRTATLSPVCTRKLLRPWRLCPSLQYIHVDFGYNHQQRWLSTDLQ